MDDANQQDYEIFYERDDNHLFDNALVVSRLHFHITSKSPDFLCYMSESERAMVMLQTAQSLYPMSTWTYNTAPDLRVCTWLIYISYYNGESDVLVLRPPRPTRVGLNLTSRVIFPTRTRLTLRADTWVANKRQFLLQTYSPRSSLSSVVRRNKPMLRPRTSLQANVTLGCSLPHAVYEIPWNSPQQTLCILNLSCRVPSVSLDFLASKAHVELFAGLRDIMRTQKKERCTK